MENLDTSNWASKNLDVDHFRNGDKIPEAKTAEDWQFAQDYGKPAWCHYDNDLDNGLKYGKLYNYHAVNDPRGLAPDGYHVPNDREWSELENLLGEEAGKKLKSKNGWEEGNGLDLIGFNAIPGGSRVNGIFFNGIGKYASFWCAADDDRDAWNRSLGYDFGDVKRSRNIYNPELSIGRSVRCVLDKD